MGFLLKAAFWLAVVIVLLPAPEGRQVVSQSGDPVDGTEAIGVARDLVADMSGFCTRNPEACDTGIAAAQAFGVKAQHGAKMLYDYLEHFTAEGGNGMALSTSPATGTIATSHTAHQSDAIGALTRQDAEMRVQNVQSIRIPVVGYGQAAQSPASNGAAPTAASTTLRSTAWQADPAAGLGHSAWRQPLTRTELASSHQESAPHDAIGLLIRQTQ